MSVIVALFVTAKKWTQSKCPSTNEQNSTSKLIKRNFIPADTRYSMDEYWKHAKWKKPDIKCHILYDSIYLKCSEHINPYTLKEISGCQRQGKGGHRD